MNTKIPAESSKYMGHFLNGNFAQIKLVVSLTFALLVDGGIVPPTR